jgi:UDP-N-acetylglucosamine:LPS N-acetylglucosamine transferase
MTGAKRILLSSGGTGGHIFPAPAPAEELARRRNEGVTGMRGLLRNKEKSECAVRTTRACAGLSLNLSLNPETV